MTLSLELGGIQDSYTRRAFEQISQQFPIGASQMGNAATVTTLPGAPVNGMEVYYLADSTNGVVWHLKYRAASASASKWEFVGGPPLSSRVDTAETTVSATYVALTTAGPSVTVPLAGDYLIEIYSEQLHSAAAQVMLHSYDVGGTGAADADSALSSSPAANMPFTVVKPRLKAGLAASTALVSKYRTTAATATFRFREMRVLPVRVGP